VKIDLSNVKNSYRDPLPKRAQTRGPHCDKCGRNFDTVTQKVRHNCEAEA
jgi:hypothetical protein